MSALALICAGVALPAAAQTTFHGAGIQKVCSPTKVGDVMNCDLRITSLDDFSDTVRVTEAWDLVDTGGDNVRVPETGNLPITEVSAGAVCTAGTGPIDLVFPCDLPNEGDFVVVSNLTYVVQADDPDPLPDQGNAIVEDLCDAPGTLACAPNVMNTLQFAGSTDLFQASITASKDGPDVSKPGDTITYTVLVTNTSSPGTPALICTVDDSLVGDLGSITPGVPLNFDYTIPAEATGTVENEIHVTCGFEGFTNQIWAGATHTVTLVAPAVELTKVCRPDSVLAGETMFWDITALNTGDAALDCVVNDPTAGLVDSPLSLEPASDDTVTVSRATTLDDVPGISNTASISCTLAGTELPNEIVDEATADCEVRSPPEGEEICRTPGFWGTHAGSEKNNSTNLTQAVIDAGGGSLEICGQTISNTDTGSMNSALEAICVSDGGTHVRQLTRQLTAMALNCIISGGGADCAGTSVETLFADANAACAAGDADLGGFIDDVDAFNNGLTNDCHSVELGESDVFDGIEPLPGPAGSSNSCNVARKNAVFPTPAP